MDLLIPIISGLGVLGYNLKNNTSKTTGNVRNSISNNDLNSQTNSYTNTFTKEALAVERQLAEAKYLQSQNPASTNVIGPYFNDTCSTFSSCNLPGGVRSSSQLSGTILPSVNLQNVVETKVNSIMSSPMFSNNFLGNTNTPRVKEAFTDSIQPQSISELSGAPFDNDSFKTTPFFGSNVKQNTDLNKTQSTLDRYTGNDRNLQKNKVESGPMFENTQQNIFGSQVSQDRSRFYQSNLKTNLQPLPQIKEAPLPPDAFRGQYKNVDQLRVKPRYEDQNAPPIEGLRTAVVSQQVGYNKNRPETAYKSDASRTFVSGQIRESLPLNYSNGKTSVTESQHAGGGAYLGGGLANQGPRQIKVADSLDKENFESALDDIDNILFTFSSDDKKRNTDKTSGFRNIGRRGIDTFGSRESYKNYPENERDTTSTMRLNVASDLKQGIEYRNKQKSRTTIKEGTLFSHTGDAVSNLKGERGSQGELTRKTNRVGAKNYLYNPNGSSKQYRETESFETPDIKSNRETISNRKNYDLQYKEGSRVSIGADTIGETRQKDDLSYGSTDKYSGHLRINNVNNIYNDIPKIRNYGINKVKNTKDNIDISDRIGSVFTEQLMNNDFNIDINRKRKIKSN